MSNNSNDGMKNRMVPIPLRTFERISSEKKTFAFIRFFVFFVQHKINYKINQGKNRVDLFFFLYILTENLFAIAICDSHDLLCSFFFLNSSWF